MRAKFVFNFMMEHHLYLILTLTILLQLRQGQCFKNSDVIEVDHEVETKNLTELKGYRLDLSCEGLEIVEKVKWYKNGRAMLPTLVKKETKNRVLVKPEHQSIEFHSLRHSDTGLYTCVTKDGNQVGHHRVTVETVTSLADIRSPISWMFWATILALVVFFIISSIIYFKL